MTFKTVKALTLPTLSLKDPGTVAVLRFESPIRQGKNLNPEDTKEPAHVANVLLLEDCGDRAAGEVCQIVLAKQLRGTLEEEHPNDGYVGKIFRLENMGKKKGGKSAEGYNVFKILEGTWDKPLPPVGSLASGEVGGSAAKAPDKKGAKK